MKKNKPEITPDNINELVSLERVILSAILIDNMAIYQVAEKIDNPEMFYGVAHKTIWGVILRLHAAGTPIDMITVMSASTPQESGNYGGPAYLAELSNYAASSANIEYHSAILWQWYIKRQVIAACADTIQGLREGEDIPETMYGLTQTLYRMQQSKARTLVAGSGLAKQLYERVSQIYDTKGSIGETLTGVPELDTLIGGAEDGDLIIFAGRPKSGKSSVANTILKHFIDTNRPIYMGSAEMQNVKTAARLAAALSGVPTRTHIETGQFLSNLDNSKDAVMRALELIEKSLVRIDEGELSIPKMISVVNYQYHVNGVKHFMFDRIGLFKEVATATDDYKARMNVTSAMRQLSNKLGVIIIAFSQVNTDAEKTAHKRPLAQHIFGGIGAQSNATKCVMIYRPQMYGFESFADGPFKGEPARGMIEMYTVLNNYLDTGSCKLIFDAKTQLLKPEFAFTIEPQLSAAAANNEDIDLPF